MTFRPTEGYFSRVSMKILAGIMIRAEGSIAITDEERTPPSNADNSPKHFPSSSTSNATSFPDEVRFVTRTEPLEIK